MILCFRNTRCIITLKVISHKMMQPTPVHHLQDILFTVIFYYPQDYPSKFKLSRELRDRNCFISRKTIH